MIAQHRSSGRRIPCTPPGSQYEVEFSERFQVIWGYMNPIGNPCFSVDLLNTIREFDCGLERDRGRLEINGRRVAACYYVVGSRVPRVFNLGGDLALFLERIGAEDRDGLSEYARLCIDGVYARIHNYFCPSLTTISLIQGEALGGGFEGALASDVVIAERNVRMGLPEVLFNLFPGMGAYNLIARRIGRIAAEELIASGKIYEAEELYGMGLIDVLADDGQGEQAVEDWIERRFKRRNAYQALADVGRVVEPITRQQLDEIARLWVEAAMRLEEKDLRMMSRLVKTQMRRLGSASNGAVTEAEIAAVVH